MDGDMAEKFYEAAEDSLRASLAAWGAAFDAAQATGNDRVRWIVEDAAWTATRRANAVRNLAWEIADQVLSSSREQVRQKLIGHLEQQASAPAPAAQPPPSPAMQQQPPQQGVPPPYGTQSVVRLAPNPADGSSA
jgi:hypothetical protein